MLQADYLLFVGGISNDQFGRPNFHSVSEILYAPEVPVNMATGLFAIARLTPSTKPTFDGRINVRLVGYLNGKEVIKADEVTADVTIIKDSGWAAVLGFPKPFPEFGTYTMKLYVDDKVVIERPFYVKDTHEKADLKRHREIERRVKAEGVQLGHPQGKELFEKVLRRAKKI